MEIKRVLISCDTKEEAKRLRKCLVKLGINWITGKFDSDINNEEEWLSVWEKNKSRTIYCINDCSYLYYGSYSIYYDIYYDSIYHKYTSYTTDEFIKTYGKETNTRSK